MELQANAKPPVCKLLDYGKFKFEQKKKERESKKHQSVVQLKEIKLRPKIEKHDYDFKVKHIDEFLEKGYKVKITLQFHGREMKHVDIGMQVMDKIKEDLGEKMTIEKDAKLEGRNLIMIVAPGKKSKKGKESNAKTKDQT